MRYLVHGAESYMRAYLVARWKKRFPDYVVIDDDNPLLYEPAAALIINWEKWKKKSLLAYPFPAEALFISEKSIGAKHAVHEVIDNSFSCDTPSGEDGWRQWIKQVGARNQQPLTDDEITMLLKTYGENTWRLGIAMEMKNKVGIASTSWEENSAMRVYEAWWNRDLAGMLVHGLATPTKALQYRLLRLFQTYPRRPDHAQVINYLALSWWNDLVFVNEKMGTRHNLINLYSLREERSSDESSQSIHS